MVYVKQSLRRTGSQRLLGDALCFTDGETEVRKRIWRRVVTGPTSDCETGRSDLGGIFFKKYKKLYRNGSCNVSIMVSQHHLASAKHGCRQMFVGYTVMVTQGLPSGLLDRSPTRMSVIMRSLECCSSRTWVCF